MVQSCSMCCEPWHFILYACCEHTSSGQGDSAGKGEKLILLPFKWKLKSTSAIFCTALMLALLVFLLFLLYLWAYQVNKILLRLNYMGPVQNGICKSCLPLTWLQDPACFWFLIETCGKHVQKEGGRPFLSKMKRRIIKFTCSQKNEDTVNKLNVGLPFISIVQWKNKGALTVVDQF